jgi:hypothetical protein
LWSFFCLVFCIFFAPVLSAQSPLQRKISSVECHQCSLPDALRQISEASGVNVLFSDDFFSYNRKRIDLHVEQKTVAAILEDLLEGHPVAYRSVDAHTIALFYKTLPDRVVEGWVRCAESGEPLTGASIAVVGTSTGVIANESGKFSLRLPAASVEQVLQIRYIGYQTANVDSPSKSGTVSIRLHPKAALNEVQVVGHAAVSQPAAAQTGLLFLPEKWSRAVISTGGEPDLLRQLTLLPGFQAGADGFGGLHVRGGNGDQNLILLDGVQIYNPAHSFGAFSVLNPSLIRDVRLYKGVQPAAYGGRLSAALDIRMREANRHCWQAEVASSPLATTATVEGPLGRRGGALLLSGRVSWTKPFVQNALKTTQLQGLNQSFIRFDFADFYLKWGKNLGDRHRLSLTAYGGGDYLRTQIATFYKDTAIVFKDTTTAALNWGNRFASLRWHWQPNSALHGITALTLSGFEHQLAYRQLLNDYDLRDKKLNQILFQLGIISNIGESSLRTDWHWQQQKAGQVDFGVAHTQYDFEPSLISLAQSSADSNFSQLPIATDPVNLGVSETAAYVDWSRKWQHFSTAAGLRVVHFARPRVRRSSAQPRLRAACQLGARTQLDAAFGTQEQFVHVLSLNDFSLPTDVWLPINQRSPRQQSRQLSVGLNQALPDSLHLRLEAYHKRMGGLVGFTAENFFNIFNQDLALDVENWDTLAVFGSGTARGLELLLEKRRGRLTGLLSYTVSDSKRHFAPQTQPYRFDTRHSLSASGLFRIQKHWHLSGLWQFNSGFVPTDLSAEEAPVFFGDFFGVVPYESLQKRLPDYHRLDLSLHYSTVLGKTEIQLVAGIYNAYNRRNIIFVREKHVLTDPDRPPAYEGVLSILRSPVLRLSIKRTF